MASELYVALSGEIALEHRLTTVANNVANANTAGFRAEEVSFDTLLSRVGTSDTAYSSSGDTYISRRPGAIVQTGNPLDVAIAGDGWMAVDAPGGTAYTRDGRLQISETGELVTVTGYPVLDAGGSHIAVKPDNGPVRIALDGTVTQNGAKTGGIGLFTIPDTARLARAGDGALVKPDQAAYPVEDPTTSGFRQGFYESSNVNPVLEMTRLIMIQRAFEQAVAFDTARDESVKSAIETLGSTS